ncbi:MAG: transporter [Mogibacterium sp.]|nr:transporter [Mogibacterium sp.]
MSDSNKKGSLLPVYLLMHFGIFIFTMSTVCAKLAAQYEMFSFHFFLFYGLDLFGAFLFAVIWQQVLKRMPLSVAYANKPVSLVWGLIWGALLFQEQIKWNMIVGAIVIFAGILIIGADNEGAGDGKAGDTDA